MDPATPQYSRHLGVQSSETTSVLEKLVTMTIDRATRPWLRFDRHELAGAFGDIGTDLPLLIALIATCRLDAASVCIMFGLLQIATGILYGILACTNDASGAPPGVDHARNARYRAGDVLLGCRTRDSHRTVLPLYLASVGLGAATLGVMEGAADFAFSLSKLAGAFVPVIM